MSIVHEPVGILEFLLGPAAAAKIEAAQAARASASSETPDPTPPAVPLAGSNLGDSWPAWTDADHWNLGPDAEPIGDAPCPALPSMADWIESQAQAIRLNGSDLAWWLAERVDEIARECRLLRAETPREFDARSEVMADPGSSERVAG